MNMDLPQDRPPREYSISSKGSKYSKSSNHRGYQPSVLHLKSYLCVTLIVRVICIMKLVCYLFLSLSFAIHFKSKSLSVAGSCWFIGSCLGDVMQIGKGTTQWTVRQEKVFHDIDCKRSLETYRQSRPYSAR